MRFDSAATRSSALRRRRSARSTSWRPESNTCLTASSGSSPAISACSRISSSISSSVDLELELVGDRLEHELARDRERGLLGHPLHELLGRLARELEVGLGADPAALERAAEAVQELARARLDERAADLDVRGLDERVDRGGAELRLGLLLEHVVHPLLEVGAQLGERVELARGARQLVVERRQHLLLDLLDLDRRLGGRAVDGLELDLLRLAGGGAGQRALDLLDEPAGAELDHEVALALAVLVERVDHQHVARVGGPVLDGGELGDGLAQRFELLVDELLRHLGLGVGHLELRPVGRLGLRLDRDGRGELEVAVLRARQLVVVLGRRDRADVRRRGGVHEPAADVALDRLGEDALAADPRLQHLRRHLALAEARHLDRLGEVVRRVLDRVLKVGLRDLDGQPDLVVGKLFDLRRHFVHSSKATVPGRGVGQ